MEIAQFDHLEGVVANQRWGSSSYRQKAHRTLDRDDTIRLIFDCGRAICFAL
jgi:hypothetical protein